MKHLLSYNRTEGSCVRPLKMLYKKKCKMCNLFKSSNEFKFGNAYCTECWKDGKIKRNMHTIKEKIEDDFKYS